MDQIFLTPQRNLRSCLFSSPRILLWHQYIYFFYNKKNEGKHMQMRFMDSLSGAVRGIAQLKMYEPFPALFGVMGHH